MVGERVRLLKPGQPVRLREGALRFIRVRNWTFKEIDLDGAIWLDHKPKAYLLQVNEEDIDWETYEKERNSK